MNKQLRSDTLKKLAMLFMFIDHVGAILLQNLYINTIDVTKAQIVYDIYQVFRSVGRLAMPIFCYQAVVGLFRTRNKTKHMIVFFIAALISEIPFDISTEGKIFYWPYQNVIFTLLLGLIAVLLIRWFEESDIYADIASPRLKKFAYCFFTAAAVFSTSAVAELIHSDYGAKGVILMWIFYIFRNDTVKMSTYGIVLFLIEIALITYLRTYNVNSVISYCTSEAYACLAFFLISMDNGERRGGALLKWVGYAFYPVHMLLIYLVSLLIVK